MENLPSKDIKILRQLLLWDKRKKNLESMFYNLVLGIGLIIIIISVYYTLQDLTNRTVFFITVPGFLAGILMLWIYRLGKRRYEEKAALTNFLKSFMEKNQTSVQRSIKHYYDLEQE